MSERPRCRAQPFDFISIVRGIARIALLPVRGLVRHRRANDISLVDFSCIREKSIISCVYLLTLFGRRVAGRDRSASNHLLRSIFLDPFRSPICRDAVNRNCSFVELSSAGRGLKELISGSSIAVLFWLLLFILKFNASHVDDYHAQTLRRLGASTSPDHRPGSHFG